MTRWQIAYCVWLVSIPVLMWLAFMVYGMTGLMVPVHDPVAFWFGVGLLWLATLPIAGFLLDN